MMDDNRAQGKREKPVNAESEALAYRVIGAAIEVHRVLGPGLPEVAYKRAMSHELMLLGIDHVCEFPVDLSYKGVPVGEVRIDILVGQRLVIELKVVEALNGIHRAQALTYLHALNLELALLLNFNVPIMRDGIKRVINTF